MSFVYRGSRFYLVGVFQPPINLQSDQESDIKPPPPSSSAVQIQVEFHLRNIQAFYDRSIGRRLYFVHRFESPKIVEKARFDIHMFLDKKTSYQSLCPMLLKLNINERDHMPIIEEVIRLGCDIRNRFSTDVGAIPPKVVVPLVAEIAVVHIHIRDERELIDMAIRESVLESESRHHGIGMLPASKSAIHKALKIVKLEEDDKNNGDDCREVDNGRKRKRVEESDDRSCMICLEELPIGAYVTRMPCSHLFHGQCIVKWLKSSRFCPLCRFEIS